VPSENLTIPYEIKLVSTESKLVFKPDGFIDRPSTLSVTLVGALKNEKNA